MQFLNCRQRKAILSFLLEFPILVWTPAVASDDCEIIPPIRSLLGVQAYFDPKDSIIDPEKGLQNNRAQQRVREFLSGIERSVDDASTFHCARLRLSYWAEAGAMLDAPQGETWRDRFEALIRRQQYALGLNILALKMRSRGEALDPALTEWLRALTGAAIQLWNNKPRKGNLYVWSGVTAASWAAVGSNAREFELYADRAWHEAISEIRLDGFVDSELRRGRLALTYHRYYLSAVLMLRQFRLYAGRRITVVETNSIRRLSKRIGSGLCDPQPFIILSGEEQKQPDEWGVRIPTVFLEELWDEDWKRCSIKTTNANMVGYGGRLDITLNLLQPSP